MRINSVRDLNVKHPTLAKAAAVLITVALLAILLSQVSVADVITTLTSINPLYLVAGYFLYAFSYFFRALRFHVLLNREVGLRDLFQIVCVHNMVNSILPAKTGELSYIYLLKKVHKRSVGEGVATLVMARVFDFIAITVLFFCSILMIEDLPPTVQNGIVIIAIFMIVMIALLIGLLYFGRPFLNTIERVFKYVHLDRRRFGAYLLIKFDEVVGALEEVRVSRNLFFVGLMSFLIWSLNYAVVYLLLSSMHIALSLQKVILGSTFTLLTSLLPIQGIGGFGTTEGVWTLVFVQLGMPMDIAITSGLVYHILVVIYYVVLGMWGIVAIKHR
ncbi:conserved hypothetical protein 374 [Methanoculleus marisnigri JR1]|uniref:Uncharacterized protein n=1 Tax=Methanoculleus marisnigri (strain ATCC 35101 / DSM 1498 / JR1) TaxID=368407 RepID=A3CRY3_METMJ|nr:conserved hypothetical protein 374 [Methanoculleus marisnigri JR1]